MEEIYVNVEYDKSVDSKPSQNQTGPRSSQRRFHGAVLSLGLLSVFLLAGLIYLGVHYHYSAAKLSTIKDNLTERLQTSNTKLSFLMEEKDLLNDSLVEMTKELERLQGLSKQKKTCPEGWRISCGTCYFLSDKSGSWDKGREDCKGKGGDLVVIDSTEEQRFLYTLTNEDTWIGLSDREEEGTWKWIDGTPKTLTYGAVWQSDNGGGDPRWGEEDCAHLMPYTNEWNDRSCETSLRWICEKVA